MGDVVKEFEDHMTKNLYLRGKRAIEDSVRDAADGYKQKDVFLTRALSLSKIFVEKASTPFSRRALGVIVEQAYVLYRAACRKAAMKGLDQDAKLLGQFVAAAYASSIASILNEDTSTRFWVEYTKTALPDVQDLRFQSEVVFSLMNFVHFETSEPFICPGMLRSPQALGMRTPGYHSVITEACLGERTIEKLIRIIVETVAFLGAVAERLPSSVLEDKDHQKALLQEVTKCACSVVERELGESQRSQHPL